jgi:hypothetical protein
LETLFFITYTAGPHSIAVAVEAKNSPPDCFPHAPTVLKEIINLSFQQRFCFGNAVFYHPMRKENTRMQIIYSRFGHTFRMSRLKRAKAETNMKSEPEKRHTNPAKQAKTLHTACATAALNRICAKQHKGDQAYVHCSNI